MVQKSLLILVGDISDTSLLKSQLRLKSIFNLIVKDSVIYESDHLDALFSNTSVNVAKLCFGKTAPTLGEITSLMDTQVPEWREAKNVLFYPATLYVLQETVFSAFIQKLAMADAETLVLSDGAHAIYKISTKALLEKDARQTLRAVFFDTEPLRNLEHIDLDSSLGIWKLSTTQSRARNFNSFRTAWPFIEKRTTLVAKGKAEYRYLTELTPAVSAFFPQVGISQDEADRFSYQIEFLPMLDVGRFLIHGSLAEDSLLARLLKEVSNYFGACERHAVGTETVRASLEELFILKLEKRMQELEALPIFGEIEGLSHRVWPGGIRSLAQNLQSALSTAIRASNESALLRSHGDLCASNILLDRHVMKIKLIDPKGTVEFLPLYYDLAKLSHSFAGGYDLIMNGLTDIELDADLRLRIRSKGVPAKYIGQIRETFLDWCRQSGFDTRLVRLGEASLFLSMLPLHSDSPPKMIQQLCAAANALQWSKKGGNTDGN